LDWPGKRASMSSIQSSSSGTLIPSRVESVDWDKTKNAFVEGDNLEVLKLLQKAYYGKVKMIYIDPPYNTGSDFVYPDNYAESLQTYLEYTGQISGNGVKLNTNSKDSGRFHSNWLRMMFPRIYVARNLMREDGVLFVSIDDNEVSNLRAICDQIFGGENFVAQVIWQKKYSTKADTRHISESHDYILVYAKNSELLRFKGLKRTEDQESIYKNPDDDLRGSWTSDNLLRTEERQYAIYPIKGPSGEEFYPPKGSSWRYNREKMDDLVRDNRIWFGKDGTARPRLKRFRSEVRESVPPNSLWTFKEVGHNDEATKEVASLFGSTKSPFSSPKPVRLLKRMIEISCAPEDIVVDFFAGSGTTGHACFSSDVPVQFILVQLPHKIEDGDYSTVAEISKERLRRAGALLGMGRGEELDLDGHSENDLGFRVFKLAPSNFKRWDGENPDISPEDLAEQLDNHIDHIDPKASEEDLLYELLLKAGFMLSTKVETRELAGQTVYSVEDGALLICLEKSVDEDLIRAVADEDPLQFICLDAAFQGNDQLKTNAVQTFRARSQSREEAIVFRTV